MDLPDGIGAHETASVGVASKSGGKDFGKAKLVVAGPDGPESKEVRGCTHNAIPNAFPVALVCLEGVRCMCECLVRSVPQFTALQLLAQASALLAPLP